MKKVSSDPELEQSVIRLVFAGVVTTYLFIVESPQMWWITPILFGWIFSLSIFCHIYFSPGDICWRRIAGQLTDIVILTIVLYGGGEKTLPFIGCYLWVIIGNGFRFGHRYLVTSMVIAGVCLLYLATNQPLWIEHKAWAIGIGITVLIVPIYFAALLNRLNRANAKLEVISKHDELTGLLNRRTFDSRIASEFSRLKRYPAPFAFVLIDIDDFKSINDEYGRLIGNKVLISISEVLKQTCRDIDILARYGSDELALLLPGHCKNEDELLGERLRQAVKNCVITIGEDTIQATVNIGIAHWNDQYQTVEEWIYDAVMALFGAKKRGCNKIFKENHGLESNRKAVFRLSSM